MYEYMRLKEHMKVEVVKKHYKVEMSTNIWRFDAQPQKYQKYIKAMIIGILGKK